jgi:hypothetical protein
MLGHESNNTTTTNNNNQNIKRNLFGIRLNHDQLKDDLKDMWKEQIERQKLKWNFDFETLKPLANPTTTTTTSTTSATPKKPKRLLNDENATTGFKWTKVKTLPTQDQQKSLKRSLLNNNEYAQTTLDQREMKLARQRIPTNNAKNFKIFNEFKSSTHSTTSNSSIIDTDDEEEEEEDEAMAVPSFYKVQRRLKLDQEQSRLNYYNLIKKIHRKSSLSPVVTQRTTSPKTATTTQAPATFEPIFKFALTSNGSETPLKTSKTTNSKTLKRPKALKKNSSSQTTSLALSPHTQNLIITFSENRKDTLRSATIATPSVATGAKVNKPKRSRQQVKASTASAFTSTDSNLKQQSLLDLFKQRKRRNLAEAAVSSDEKPELAAHFLRSSTA